MTCLLCSSRVISPARGRYLCRMAALMTLCVFLYCLASNYASVQQPLLWIIIVKSGANNHRAQKYVIRVWAHLHCNIWRTQRQGKQMQSFINAISKITINSATGVQNTNRPNGAIIDREHRKHRWLNNKIKGTGIRNKTTNKSTGQAKYTETKMI